MSEEYAFAVVKGVRGRNTTEEIVAVYSDEDVAVDNAFYQFRPEIRESIRERGEDPTEQCVKASTDKDRVIYVRVEQTVLCGGLVEDITIELKR